jgi:menaquinone-specific isochorismate synthase
MGALFEQATRRLRRAPGSIRYFGGFRFDLTAPIDKHWREFGLGWLVLPRFEVVEAGGATRLACTVIPGRDKPHEVMRALDALSDCPRQPAAPALAQREGDCPDAEGWAEAVSGVTRDIAGGGGWRKVVLARRTALHCDGAVDALGILAALAEQTPRCFHFYFNPGGQAAFIGATPEQLFHRDGRTVHSEALAGTRPRGETQEEDRRLEGELLASAKDGREHGFVDSYVRAALGRMTRGVESDGAVSVLKLGSVQHLVRRMRGMLRRGFGDAALLAALHPTPAVCGEPPAAAVGRIREAEPFDRGWYAGPVGFVGRDETRMAVGIRSALVDGDAIWLFAGAGVVQGSQPQTEWQELEAKLRGIWPGRLT